VVLARYLRSDGPERGVDVAMKIPRTGTTRKKILWEAACLRKVAHAHVIKLLDVCASTPGGEEDPKDLPTLMFPPADADLASFLDRFDRPRGVPPTALARRLMGQLASALAHVHSHGIIHRDVKPQNCLLFLAAEVHEELLGPALMLADFGSARRASGDPRRRPDALAVQRVQPMTTKVCTAWYRPPELWAGTMDDHDLDADHDDVDGETTPYNASLDVWSFGAVVYEVLAGETLARRATSGAMMAQALADVIGACPRGLGAPEYIQDQRWKSWAAAAPKPGTKRPLPDSGVEWDLVRTCVKWDPAARVTMDSAKQCAWFVERVATPEAAPKTGTQSLTGTRADASTLSTACDGATSPSDSVSAETSRGRAHAWLLTDPSPPATTPASSWKRCSCSGHCRSYKHRFEGKCDCTELVIGTAYCVTCKCIVTGCVRPMHKRDYCYHHRAVLEKAEFRVQLAVAAAPVASLLMPCDVVDFLSQSTLLQHDLAMLILTAAIKEPLPVGALVEAWKQLPARYSGSDLRSAILRAVAAADGAPHGAQLDQLHRQGVCRFFGLITTAKNLGIIANKQQDQPVPRVRGRKARDAAKAAAKAAGASAQQEYRLGKNLTVYEVLDEGSSIAKCDEFLEATRAEEPCLATPSDALPGASTPRALDDLVDYAGRAGRALQRIGAKSGALPFSAEDASGYCIDFLQRKLVLARFLQQKLHESECDWSTVSKASLQSMSADAKENLEEVPDAWQASQISTFFTGRTDWALLASVYPCLWGEVADKLSTKDDRARALVLVKSKDFLRVVQNFRRTEGIAPHPAVAYKILEADMSKNLKEQVQDLEKLAKASVTPRASTPRTKENLKGQAKRAKASSRASSTPRSKRKFFNSKAQAKRAKASSRASTTRSEKKRKVNE